MGIVGPLWLHLYTQKLRPKMVHLELPLATLWVPGPLTRKPDSPLQWSLVYKATWTPLWKQLQWSVEITWLFYYIFLAEVLTDNQLTFHPLGYFQTGSPNTILAYRDLNLIAFIVSSIFAYTIRAVFLGRRCLNKDICENHFQFALDRQSNGNKCLRSEQCLCGTFVCHFWTEL